MYAACLPQFNMMQVIYTDTLVHTLFLPTFPFSYCIYKYISYMYHYDSFHSGTKLNYCTAYALKPSETFEAKNYVSSKRSHHLYYYVKNFIKLL